MEMDTGITCVYQKTENYSNIYYNDNFENLIVYKKYLNHIENTFNNYNLKKN